MKARILSGSALAVAAITLALSGAAVTPASANLAASDVGADKSGVKQGAMSQTGKYRMAGRGRMKEAAHCR